MDRFKMLPIGIEDFKEIITQNFYYIDKTNMINELLNNWSKVNLFTRPRRFGKTMALEMLEAYYEIDINSKNLFKGLEIEQNNSFEEHLNKYNIIYINISDILDKCNGAENLVKYLKIVFC